jgi:hypothetical protein
MNRRRGPIPADPDVTNDDPFKGLPHDFPLTHSRFPVIPSSGYGDLSFDPAAVQNSSTEGLAFSITTDQRDAWRDAMSRALGDLLPDRSKDKNSE